MDGAADDELGSLVALLDELRGRIRGVVRDISRGRATLADLGPAFGSAEDEINGWITAAGHDPDTYKSYEVGQFWDVFIEGVHDWSMGRAKRTVMKSLARLAGAVARATIFKSKFRAFVEAFHREEDMIEREIGSVPVFEGVYEGWRAGAARIYGLVTPPMKTIRVADEDVTLVGSSPVSKELLWRNTLERAAAGLASRGLRAAWGPRIFVVDGVLRRDYTPDDIAERAEFGIELGISAAPAGSYSTGSDMIVLYSTGSPDDVVASLFHELGHRYYYRVLDGGSRRRWVDLLRTRVRSYDEPGVSGETTEDGEPAPIEPPTRYGASNADEAFADTFMMYVTGDLERGALFEFFRDTIGKRFGESVRQFVKLTIAGAYRGYTYDTRGNIA